VVGEQGVAVHQEGLRLREVRTQLVEDGEAVGVDVAPIVRRALLQPPSVTRAKVCTCPRRPSRTCMRWRANSVSAPR
jgi:hypothetical protein